MAARPNAIRIWTALRGIPNFACAKAHAQINTAYFQQAIKIRDYLALVNLKDCPGLVLMKFYEFLRARPTKSPMDFVVQPLRPLKSHSDFGDKVPAIFQIAGEANFACLLRRRAKFGFID